MSHELRTPLNSVMVLSRVLAENREKNLNRKQIEMLNQISSSGHELQGLVNEVLDVADVEASDVQLDLKMISIQSFVARIERITSPLAWQKGLTYSIEVADDVPVQFYTDELKVSRIVRNIITNAVKFTPEGHIQIYVGHPTEEVDMSTLTYSQENGVMVRVTDTGVGIDPEMQQHIFLLFMQADDSDNRQFQGSGLGLAIASRFVSALGGDIRLDSIPGQGSTFTLLLPTHPNADSKDIETVTRKSFYHRSNEAGATNDTNENDIPAVDRIRFNGEKILVADDDMRVVFNLSAMLESLGAEALISSSAEGILRRVEESRKDNANSLALIICGREKLSNNICSAIESMREKAPGLIVLTREDHTNDKISSYPFECHIVESPPSYSEILPLIQKLLW